MILTMKDLRRWEESPFTAITAEQKAVILERFETEPDPYEWSEQDIAIQVRNFLSCGEFVKPIRPSKGPSTIPPGVEF